MTVDRRRVLGAAGALGLGVSSLALPSALAAASVVPLDLTTAGDPTYDASDVLLAGWFAVNTSTTTYPRAATLHQTASASGVSSVQAPSALTPTYPPADPGLYADNDSRNWWYLRNSAATFDPATAPHVEFAMTAGTAPLDLAAFFLGGLSALSFRIAVRVSTDGFTTSLRDGPIIDPVSTSGYRNLVVNLGNVPLVQPGATFRLRVYGYDTGATVRYTLHTNGNSSHAPFQSGRDAYDPLQGGRSAGFIGRVAA